ncbi:MAG: T9SS type A sorting domain-containing protein, partial [Bacteroidota bacterium]
MKNFFNFNKNAGALAVLLCCFFFNLGVGVAQTGQWEIPIENNKKIIVIPDDKISGACADPVGYSGIIPYSYYFMAGGGAAKLVDSAFIKTPVSKYFKVNCWDFFSYKLLIPNDGLSPTYNINYRVNGEGVPPSELNWEYNVDCYVDDLGTETINGVSYTAKRVKGRIVGGTTKAWHMIQLDKNNSFPTVYRCIVLPIVSVGQLYLDQQVPVLGTTVQPQIPFMVLHAPPGDGSFSDFQETKTTCREFVNTYAEDGSNSANLDVKLGVAGSIGFIVTTDFEFSVTFSAGLTAGDLSVKTDSKQTCVTTSQGLSTNAMTGLQGSGDVFVGYGTDLNYGLYPRVSIDPNTCIAKSDSGLIYAPTGEPRRFTWTEEQIQSDIITQKQKAANPANSARERNLAQNQADVWEKVLAQNNANKNNPNNALIESLSYSAGPTLSRESTVSILETNSIEVEHYIEFNTGISSVVEIAGSGISGGYEYKGSYRYGKTQTQSVDNTQKVSYNLKDDDTGDLFNMKVVRDPMYGTPVFRLDPGTKTSCPYQGGYQRDQPKLKHNGTTNDHITLQGNPVGSSATFKIDLCNDSNEPRIYNLQLNSASNLNGAVVSAAGVPLNGNDDGQVFPVPANGCIQGLVVEVKQLSANSPLSYPDLELFLYAPCEKDIQSSVFASIFFGNATGVNDLADNSLLSVSPNPTSGWLQISLPEGNSLEAVRVMDLSGKTVRNLELGAAASKTELDLSGLPKGIYALQARAEGQVFVKKVVVE